MLATEIKKFLNEYDIRPNKLLGQHFLVDQNILQKIIKVAGIKNTDTVLEIGPGTGTLTFELAKHAGKVITVEKDRALAEILKEEIEHREVKNIEMIASDILKMPRESFARMVPYRVVANIPYYLTARLIRKLLGEVPQPNDILFTMQKEVAERIVSKPPRMNLLALAVQIYGTPKILFKIPRNAFWPAPEVDGTLIAINDISKKNFLDGGVLESDFFKIVRTAFQTKRKILLNSLARQTSINKPSLEIILASLGIAPLARPEELSVRQWISLVARLGKNS
ncbi:MAG: ribosomal RNA small subunit methyltransferase A [Candidatus Sungbacteria bacterium RIFCSPLOWO2_02_FULL_48_13b]|uniref:Ribosomal RNA small subunit methyltransferase A n=1 Tax=Candidatus Sungbacteria bacterium RIFCSPLOWO2_02_FULL_48_13b TaxID=1802283 RepID=A0A1G2LHC0_9BACT|nr:MAG: ribosomal RNA small subunit methyltransferase A [Candidatus Sungbacteria bacterium RIFCSPLOWO2_02_FULL_48_13b]